VKLAFKTRAKPAVLVYTPDVDDAAQVSAVEKAMRAVVGPRAKLTYKTDEMTHAGLYSHSSVAGGLAPRGSIGVATASTHRTGTRDPCRFYNTPRGCSRGASCPFLHDGREGGVSPPVPTAPPLPSTVAAASASPMDEFPFPDVLPPPTRSLPSIQADLAGLFQ
jgi:hypothetical protein